MKSSVVIIGLMVVVAVAVALWLLARKNGSVAVGTTKAGTLEEKLTVLEECGLKLAEPFTVDDLLKSWDREEYEKNGYNLVLVALGMTEEQEPWRNHCDNLWHFDTECIAGHGSYKRIAERVVEMAQGSLPLQNIEDHVDAENEIAWLSFIFNGKKIKLNCKVEDDWVDPSIFGKFVDILRQSDSSKIYIYYDLGGQDRIIGCVLKEEFDRLKKHGINFVPLL